MSKRKFVEMISHDVQDNPTKPESAELPKQFPDDDALLKLPYVKSKAKCSQSFDELVLYYRPEANRQLDFMDTVRAGVIRGPPGCGKSTTAWCYVLQYAQQFPQHMLCWVQARHKKRIIIHNGTIWEERLELHDMHRVGEMNVKALFIDGITEKNYAQFEQAAQQAVDSNLAKILLVTSMQFSATSSPSFGTEHEVKAWTLQEYISACEHAPFFAQVKGNLGAETDKVYEKLERQELIERKFTVAGYSARWMFDMTEQDVLTSIRKSLRRENDVRTLFQFTVGDQSPAAINHLVLMDPTVLKDEVLVFTSDAVARAAAKNASLLLVRDLYSLVDRFGNDAMKGHAVEIDFLASVREHKLAGRVQHVAEPAPQANLVAVKRVFEPTFDDTFTSVDEQVIDFQRDVVTEESPHTHIPGTWFIPKVSNQGGFDCVQLLERGGVPTLRFVQVTIQKDHVIRMDYMRTFLQALNALRANVLPTPEEPIAAIEVVVTLPCTKALHAAPPSAWKVVGEESGRTTRSGIRVEGRVVEVTRRVAGFQLTK